MEDKILFWVVLSISFTGILAGEWCTEYDSDWWDTDTNTIYCTEGCCGDGWDQHCCISAEAGMIIGIVIGSIALVAIIVSVLVAVFCCCRKSRGRAGQVCQPAGAQTTIQMQGMPATNMAYGQVGYNGAVHYPVVTSNMAPGTVQQWQQPPPSYDQLTPNKEQPQFQ